MMRDFVGTSRCEELGAYMLLHGATVRETARQFGISKSTVHKDVTEHLSKVNAALFAEVAKVLAINKMERHLRGGEATRQKYLAKKRTAEKAKEENFS